MRLDVQGRRQPPEGTDRWIAGAAFKIADVAAFHLRFEGELLQGHALELPVMPDILTKKLDHIHASIWPDANRGNFACIRRCLCGAMPERAATDPDERKPPSTPKFFTFATIHIREGGNMNYSETIDDGRSYYERLIEEAEASKVIWDVKRHVAKGAVARVLERNDFGAGYRRKPQERSDEPPEVAYLPDHFASDPAFRKALDEAFLQPEILAKTPTSPENWILFFVGSVLCFFNAGVGFFALCIWFGRYLYKRRKLKRAVLARVIGEPDK